MRDLHFTRRKVKRSARRERRRHRDMVTAEVRVVLGAYLRGVEPRVVDAGLPEVGAEVAMVDLRNVNLDGRLQGELRIRWGYSIVAAKSK